MKTTEQRPRFTQTLIALAVLAAIGQAQAQDATPQSSVSVGAGAVSGDSSDRARFGLFNGMREDRGYGLLDFTYLGRDAGSGMWTTIEGRNLGLDTRELGVTVRKLGDWKVTADYSELVRYNPYTINTSAQGMGSTAITYSRLDTPGTGQDVNLDMKRKAFSLGASKWFGGALQFEASFKTEDKEGSRMFGRGFACSGTWIATGNCATNSSQWALLLMPEAVDSTIRQGEAKLTFAQGGLLLTAGYSGSFYTNANGHMDTTVAGTSVNNPLGVATALDSGLRTTLGLPFALPPDSQAHQVFVAGAYRFTPTTAVNFKYARTHATQNEDFAGNGFSAFPAGQSNLGGVINTTIAQFGVTARPMPKLSLLANVRYEDKENKTPIALYNIEGGETTRFTNGNPSPKRLASKVEGSYLLPENIRATLGFDWENVNHGEFTPTDSVAGLSGLREKTEEKGYRAELRRSMSEQLTGSISFVHSDRKGDSPWLKPLSLTQGRGVIEANPDPGCVPPAAPAINNCIYNRTGIFPFFQEDRKRDKVRLMASFIPTEQLSLQLFVENGKDKFEGPTTKGLKDSGMKMFSVDANYRVSDDWSLTAFASRGDSTVNSAHSSGYVMQAKDTSTSLGLGMRGKASEKLQLAADFTYLNDSLKYDEGLDSLASAANVAYLALTGGLPDVTYRVLRLKLTGDYALNKQSSIRLALIHERSKFNEWTWQWNNNSFLYADNTTVWAKENQNVTFAGVTYTYRFK